MKIKRKTVISLIAASLACSCGMTAGAGTVNRDMLIRGLLMREDNSSQYRIMDYNTNGDNRVNVIDLCRVLKDDLYGGDYTRQYIRIEPAAPSDSGQQMDNLIIPVKIQGNYNGVSAVSFNIEYDKKYFTLRDAYASDGGSLTFSKRNGSAQYTASDGRYSSEGEFIYFVFSPASEVPASVYNFKLNNIRCVVQENSGVPRTLSSEECPLSTECSFNFMWPVNMPVATTTVLVTEPPVTEPPVTEPPATEPPVTTTVTTKPPVIATPIPKDIEYDNIDDLERQVAELIIQDRKQRLGVTVTLNNGLCKAADIRAEELSRKWDASRPDGKSDYQLFHDEVGINVRGFSQLYISRTSNPNELLSYLNQYKPSSFDITSYRYLGVGHVSSPGEYWVFYVGNVE